MPLKVGYSEASVRFNAKALAREGRDVKQVYAIVLERARKAAKKRRVRLGESRLLRIRQITARTWKRWRKPSR